MTRLGLELEVCRELGRWHSEFQAQSRDEQLKWLLWLPERMRREAEIQRKAMETAKRKPPQTTPRSGRGRPII